MKKIKTAIIFSLVLVVNVQLFSQNNYFVSKNGNNTNNGSESMPWQTIQYGIDNLQPGDVLNILEGTYNEKLVLKTSGTKNNLTTIKSYNNTNVIIDGSGLNNENAMFYAWQKSFFRIEGIHFTNSYYNGNGQGGIFIVGSGDTIEIINCKISNISVEDKGYTTNTKYTQQPSIIFIGNSITPLKNILVSGTEIFDCNPGGSQCLSVLSNVEKFKFINNYIHDNFNIGIDVVGHHEENAEFEDQPRDGVIKNNTCSNNINPAYASAGIYVDGGKDIIIENNTVYNNSYGIEVGCEKPGAAENITVRNNLIYNNLVTGLALGAYSGSEEGNVLKTNVFNNTFYKNGSSHNHSEILFSKSENVKVNNNIFHLADKNFLFINEEEQANLTLMHNLIFNTTSKKSVKIYWNNKFVEGLEMILAEMNVSNNNVFGNPKFNNVDELDFSLTKSSVAIDKGDPNHIIQDGELDINGDNRIFNNIVDCGADEYHNSLNTVKVSSHLGLKVFPNPTYNNITLTSKLKNYSFDVKSITGKLILENNGLSGSQVIEIRNLKPSLYFLTVYNAYNQKLKTFKIIKN